MAVFMVLPGYLDETKCLYCKTGSTMGVGLVVSEMCFYYGTSFYYCCIYLLLFLFRILILFVYFFFTDFDPEPSRFG